MEHRHKEVAISRATGPEHFPLLPPNGTPQASPALCQADKDQPESLEGSTGANYTHQSLGKRSTRHPPATSSHSVSGRAVWIGMEYGMENPDV